MRHRKHRHQLGVKKEHHMALMANLVTALFKHGRIKTTQAKAKALRPFAERIITLACKASVSENTADKLSYRRRAIAKIRDSKIVAKLFDERAKEFINRPGGYTRIYKLLPRLGDAASMALIELIDASDEGYKKSKRKHAKKKSIKLAPRAKSLDAEVASTKKRRRQQESMRETNDGTGKNA